MGVWLGFGGQAGPGVIAVVVTALISVCCAVGGDGGATAVAAAAAAAAAAAVCRQGLMSFMFLSTTAVDVFVVASSIRICPGFIHISPYPSY